MSLADAIREVAQNPPPPLTITDHPVALRALGELLDEREQRESGHRGAAAPAA